MLERIARIACGYPKAVLAAALLLTALAWIPPLTAGVDQAFNAARLLPQDVPAARDFSDAVIDFDTIDEAVVVIRLGTADDAAAPGGEGIRRRQAHLPLAGRLGDRIVERLRAAEYAPWVQNAFCRKYSDEDRDYLVNEALPAWGLLLVPEAEWPALAKALAPDSIRGAVAELARRLRLPGLDDAAREALILFDAAGLGRIFFRSLGQSLVGPDDAATAEAGAPTGGEGEDGEGGQGGQGGQGGNAGFQSLGKLLKSGAAYLVDRERRMLLVAVQPTQPAQSLAFANELCALIRREAAAAYEDLVPPAARTAVRLEFGGGYEVSVAYMESVNSALLNTLSTTLVGVVLLFGFCYRRPGVLLYIGVPLLMIVSWTIGAGWLAFGQLNLVSCAFAAVLVCLCVDYAIHIYNRYVEERAAGRDAAEAFRLSLAYAGGGVFIGMVTTAAAFLGMLATRFSQLVEFGALASIGLVFSIPVMFFVMPALVTLRDRIAPEGSRIHAPVRFGLPTLAGLVERRPRLCGGLGLGLAALCALGLALFPGTPAFDSGVANLRPPSPAFDLAAEIARAFANRNPNSLMLVAYSSQPGNAGQAEALEKAAALTGVAAELERETQPDGRPMLADHESLARFIPAPSTQRRLMDYLAAHADFTAAINAFREAAAASGLARGLYADHIQYTVDLLENHRERIRERDILLPSDLARSPLQRYVKRLVAERRREVDLRHPFPGDLAFPVTLAAAARARSGAEKAPAGAVFRAPGELRALLDAPGLSHADGVKRVLLRRPGWAVKTMIYLPPPAVPGKRAFDDAWIDAMQERFHAPDSRVRAADDTLLTGIPFLAFELGRIVKADFWRLSVGVMAAALLVLCLFYWRHPRRIVSCLAPIVLGLLYLLGIMAATGVEFNFVNTLAVPIIIGLSVDNGIHLTERYIHDRGAVRGLVEGSGRAIVVTGLTSMVGFGSLSLVGVAWTVLTGWGVAVAGLLAGGLWLAARAGNGRRRDMIFGATALAIAAASIALWWGWGTGGGIQSLGVLMILGLTTLMAASLAVMPALLARYGRSLLPDGTTEARPMDNPGKNE